MKIIVTLIMSATLFACTTTQKTNVSNQQLVDAFEYSIYEDASDSQGEDSGRRANIVNRWTQDIIFYIELEEGVYGANTGFISRRLKNMGNILPIDIRRPKADETVNLGIIFKNEEHFTINGDDNVLCYAGYNADEDGHITIAGIVLPGKNLEGAYKCFDHELMHAIGFSSHVKDFKSTLARSIGHTHRIRATLSYMHGEDYITKWDKYLITTLYGRELTAGMDRSDVLPIVREITAARY